MAAEPPALPVLLTSSAPDAPGSRAVPAWPAAAQGAPLREPSTRLLKPRAQERAGAGSRGERAAPAVCRAGNCAMAAPCSASARGVSQLPLVFPGLRRKGPVTRGGGCPARPPPAAEGSRHLEPRWCSLRQHTHRLPGQRGTRRRSSSDLPQLEAFYSTRAVCFPVLCKTDYVRFCFFI